VQSIDTQANPHLKQDPQTSTMSTNTKTYIKVRIELQQSMRLHKTIQSDLFKIIRRQKRRERKNQSAETKQKKRQQTHVMIEGVHGHDLFSNHVELIE